MKLPLEAILLTWSIIWCSTAVPIALGPSKLGRRGASFENLRGLTRLKDDYTSYKVFSHPEKFFHEADFSPHYDGRFADIELSHDVRSHHLRLLLKSYLDTMHRLGVRTWLMHGCLLGWWWNGKIMPWDTDVDVMMDEMGIKELGSWWNMTVHHFTADELRLPNPSALPRPSQAYDLNEENAKSDRMLHEDIAAHGKKYLLEVNPYYTNSSTRDRENVIDARWIDTSTGLFIDITTVHVQPIVDPAAKKANDEDDIELYTKDQHAYSYSQVFPLRASTFEGLPVYVPYNYEELLLDEYGYRSITHKSYRGWQFDEEHQIWIATPEAMEVTSPGEQKSARDRKSFFEKFQHGKDGR